MKRWWSISWWRERARRKAFDKGYIWAWEQILDGVPVEMIATVLDSHSDPFDRGVMAALWELDRPAAP